MFDFSFAEILLVAIVGLLVIGPEELPGVVRNCKKIIAKVKGVAKDFTSSITDVDEVSDLKDEAKKLNEDLKTIIDLDGNEQVTYDVSDLDELRDHNSKNKNQKKNLL